VSTVKVCPPSGCLCSLLLAVVSTVDVTTCGVVISDKEAAYTLTSCKHIHVQTVDAIRDCSGIHDMRVIISLVPRLLWGPGKRA